MKIFNFEFFKRIGFYFSLASIATLIAGVLSYTFGFTGVLLEYNSDNVLKLAIIGVIVSAGMLVIDLFSNYAPVALWVTAFASLLAYVTNIYMYFTGVFYNGVSLEAFGLNDPIVIISTVLIFVGFILANVAMYMNHSAEED